jgi:hypothetical protein
MSDSMYNGRDFRNDIQTMSGVAPYREIQEIASKLPGLTGRADIVEALDRVEYLFEVIPPELQDPVEQLIGELRRKLQSAGN